MAYPTFDYFFAGEARNGTLIYQNDPADIPAGMLGFLFIVATAPITVDSAWTTYDSGTAGSLYWARCYAEGPQSAPFTFTASGDLCYTGTIHVIGVTLADIEWGTVGSGTGDVATAPGLTIPGSQSWVWGHWAGLIDSSTPGVILRWDADTGDDYLGATQPTDEQSALTDVGGTYLYPQAGPVVLVGTHGLLDVAGFSGGVVPSEDLRVMKTGPSTPVLGEGGDWVAFQMGLVGNPAAWRVGSIGFNV